MSTPFIVVWTKIILVGFCNIFLSNLYRIVRLSFCNIFLSNQGEIISC